MIHPIYIPSKNRPEAKFLELIKDLDTEKHLILEPQDIDKYSKWKDYYKILNLQKNDQGLPFARDFGKNYAENNKSKWYWLIDDDITRFYKTENKKNKHITPEEALSSAQDLFNVMPVALGALEYQQYAWSQKKPFKLNSYADCVVCFNVERTKKYKYDLNFKLKQDRDMALQIMTDNQYVMRALQISFACPSYGSNKGGLHEIYKQNLEKEMAEKLINKWGSKYVSIQIKDHSVGQRYDAKINWKAFKVDIQ